MLIFFNPQYNNNNIMAYANFTTSPTQEPCGETITAVVIERNRALKQFQHCQSVNQEEGGRHLSKV